MLRRNDHGLRLLRVESIADVLSILETHSPPLGLTK